MALLFGGGGGPLSGILPFAAPAHPCAMESNAAQLILLTSHTNKKTTPMGWLCYLVEAAGIEPASASTPPLDLHAYPVYCFSRWLPDRQGKPVTSLDKF